MRARAEFSEEDFVNRMRQLLRPHLPPVRPYFSSAERKGGFVPANVEKLDLSFLFESPKPLDMGLNHSDVSHRFSYTGRNIAIHSLHDPRLKLTSPIWVYVEQVHGRYIAYSSDFNNVRGFGKDEDGALDNYREALAEFYFDLKGKRLGRHLQIRFNDLQFMVQEVGN